MSKKHSKYFDRKDSEDSNRSFKEPNSIIYQIPMNYKTYQEMKEGSTRTSSRPGTNYTNNMSSQSAGNLKLLMETEDSTMRTKSKHDNFESIKTPGFTTNKVNEGLNEISQGTQQTRNSISHRGNTHRTEDDRYTKKVFDSAIQYCDCIFCLVNNLHRTANKLKTQKEKLGKYMDQVILLEEEISKNARRCLAEFNERHNKALEQLEKYFYTRVTRIKDMEAEKKDDLQSKHFMSRNHMQELSTLINTLEAKIQGEPSQIPIQVYEDKALDLEKYVSKLSHEDMFVDKKWKEFQVPVLELNLSAVSTNMNQQPSVDDNSEMASLLKGHDLDPISITKRTHSVLSPKMLININDNSQLGKTRFEYDAKDRKGTGRDRHDNGNQPLKYLQAVDLSKDERNRKRSHQAEKEEVPRERHTSYHRESTSRGDNVPLKSERLSYDNKKARRDEQEVPKSARVAREESRIMTDRNKEDENYQSKARKYKHLLKKMENDAKEKDQVIKDMVKSYKELENMMQSRTSREKADSRNRSRSDLYDDVQKSMNRPTKDTQNDSSPNVMRASSHIKKRSTHKEEELKKDLKNESYDAVKKKYKYLRGADKVKERPTTSRATLDNSNMSLTARDNSRNRSIEVQPKKSSMKSRQGSAHFNSGNVAKQKENQAERRSVKEGDNSVKVRVYIPFGQSPYSTYHIMKINKQTTVSDLLQRLFVYFEISENRRYKYFIGVKPNEYSSETILLSSEQLGSYIEASDEKKGGSWPKFYLRACDDKYVEENQNPNVHRGKK